jgi:hypothetical protein
MTDTKYTCPNCGGEVLSTLQVLGADGKPDPDLEVKPKGSVGVCQDCNAAVSMTKENAGELVTEPEDNPDYDPREDPGPVRPEDEVEVPIAAVATTDEEVPPEPEEPEA